MATKNVEDPEKILRDPERKKIVRNPSRKRVRSVDVEAQAEEGADFSNPEVGFVEEDGVTEEVDFSNSSGGVDDFSKDESKGEDAVKRSGTKDDSSEDEEEEYVPPRATPYESPCYYQYRPVIPDPKRTDLVLVGKGVLKHCRRDPNQPWDFETVDSDSDDEHQVGTREKIQDFILTGFGEGGYRHGCPVCGVKGYKCDHFEYDEKSEIYVLIHCFICKVDGEHWGPECPGLADFQKCDISDDEA